jgi:sugar/nucleoside kinase (ribokinase family)
MSNDVEPISMFIAGALLAALVSLTLTCDNSNPATIRAFEKLCKHNVPITCSIHGNYYLWDEKIKASFEISASAVITLASGIKE